MRIGRREAGLSSAAVALELALAVSTAACAPTLNWRVVSLSAGAATAMFPCRPDAQQRAVRLDGQAAPMHLSACAAAGSTYALTQVDVSDSSAAERALRALRAIATENIRGAEAPPFEWRVRGARLAERTVVTGHLPNGEAVVEYRASLVAGSRVFRLSVLGTAPPPADAVDYFFASFALTAR